MMNMKTRFDGTLWIGAGGQAFRPAEMGTDHLLNTVKMLKNRPGVVVSMVVRDIEATPDCCPFDPFGGGHSELVKQSLFNITSLSPEQVSDYALNSPLGMAMKAELLSRGVNVENYLSMIEGPETLLLKKIWLIFVTLRSVKQSTGSLPLKSRLNSTMKTTFPKMLIWMGSWMLGPMTLLKNWKFLKKGCMSNGV